MKILLTCCIGMSTSLLAETMRQSALEQHRDDTIDVLDIEKAEEVLTDYDVVLLAPQLKHMYKRLVEDYGQTIPIAMIDNKSYGTLDGTKVLNDTIKMMKKSCE